MKRALIKIAAVLFCFILAVLITSNIINVDSADMTVEMGIAKYPIVTTEFNGTTINRMYGYTDEMELSYMRDSITPLMSGRKMRVVVDTYGATVLNMKYEVRTVDSSRLIEDTNIEDFTVDSRKIITDLVIKDLIENNKEYEFILKITIADGTELSYYTRIISPEEYHVADKLEYVSDFSSKTFNKVAAEESMKTYLESNSSGDNTNYGYVNIHSSFDQVTWGDLTPLRVTDPVITIKELSPLTGSFVVDSCVSTNIDSKINYYKVREFFRVRYSKERMYLLDYERTMDQFFIDEKSTYEDGNIMLGVNSGCEDMVESEDGNNIAFTAGGRLYLYNVMDNKIAFLFGFYDTFSEDMRIMNDKHDIKIMKVDEAGNVTFLVYGYMNRGDHEGKVGTTAFYYDAAVNTIEELTFINSTHAPDLLMKEVKDLSYVNANSVLYMLIGSKLYEINTESRKYEVLADNLTVGSYQVSKNNKMVCYQLGNDTRNCQELMLMNLETMQTTRITVKMNETVSPLGFMGEDLIYGIADKTNITNDRTGNKIVPMYQVNIFNEYEGMRMSYSEPDTYVVGCEVNSNLITLTRVEMIGENNFIETTNDQIVNAENVEATKNQLTTINSGTYKKLTVIKPINSVDAQTVKHLKPQMVLFEGDRNIFIDDTDNTDKYIVYGRYGVDSFYIAENNAVNRAYSISGIVMDADGDYVWKKTSRSSKNQIMAIEHESITENRGSLAVCLDTMINLEGVVRNSQYMLGQGDSVIDILKDALENYEILDLSECTLDMVLYYVNMDIPVLAMMDDGSAVLIVGFNENDSTIVLMNPLEQEIYKMDAEAATRLFEENGNCFITYIERSID